MKLILGYDEFGMQLGEMLREHLIECGHEIDMVRPGEDMHEDYPEIAEKVALAISRGEYSRGILVCGTGIGMAIVANKVPGVRAACCHDLYSAERSRKSNDAQIITLGAQVIRPTAARGLIDVWLRSEFEGGRSARKVAAMVEIDRRYRRPDS